MIVDHLGIVIDHLEVDVAGEVDRFHIGDERRPPARSLSRNGPPVLGGTRARSERLTSYHISIGGRVISATFRRSMCWFKRASTHPKGGRDPLASDRRLASSSGCCFIA